MKTLFLLLAILLLQGFEAKAAPAVVMEGQGGLFQQRSAFPCAMSWFHNDPGGPCNIIHTHYGIEEGCAWVPVFSWCHPIDTGCINSVCPNGC